MTIPRMFIHARRSTSRNGSLRGILKQESVPSFYAYFQEFEVPDTGERLIRKGFIGLGAVEDYEARIVHRHEQTLVRTKEGQASSARAHAGAFRPDLHAISRSGARGGCDSR